MLESVGLPLFLAIPITLILLIVPGYFTYRLILTKKDGHGLQPPSAPAANSLNVAESLFWIIALSIIICGWVALVLAELAFFSIWALLLIIALWSALAAFFTHLLVPSPLRGERGRVRGDTSPFLNREATRGRGWGVRLQDWLLIGLLVGTTGLFYLAPHQTILGGQDSGVYYNTGVNIARTGSLIIKDPLLTTLGEVNSRLLPQYLQGMPGKPDRYLFVQHQRNSGFYVENNKEGLTTGEVIPQFFHLYPAYLAIGAALFGVIGGSLVNPSLGVMGVFALYLLACRLFPGRRGLAFLASLLLALNAIQVWFSRHTMWEILGQFLILTALYAFTLIQPNATLVGGNSVPDKAINRLGSLVGGVALGMLCLAHAQFPFLVWILLVYLIWMRLTRRWNATHWWLLGGFGGGFIHAVLHIRLFSLAYTEGIYHNVIQDMLRSIIPLTIAVTVAFFGLVLLDAMPNRLRSLESWLTKRWRWFALAMGVIVVVYLLFSYFGRVYLLSTDGQGNYPDLFFSWQSYIGGLTTEGPERMLLRLGWYFSPVGILLVIVGAGFMFARITKQTAMFLLLSMSLTVFFLDFSYTQELYIYSMRRYIPATLPLFSILIAYACLVVLPDVFERIGTMVFKRNNIKVRPVSTTTIIESSGFAPAQHPYGWNAAVTAKTAKFGKSVKTHFLGGEQSTSVDFGTLFRPVLQYGDTSLFIDEKPIQDHMVYSINQPLSPVTHHPTSDSPYPSPVTPPLTPVSRARQVGMISGIILGAAIALFMLWTGRTIFTLPQYGADSGRPGMVKQFEELASQFSPQDLLIISGDFQVDHKFAAPLTYSFGRNTIVQNQAPVNEELPQILQKWQAKGYNIKLLLGPNGGRFAPHGYQLVYRGEYTFNLYQLDERPTQKPNNAQTNLIRYELYDLVPEAGLPLGFGEGKMDSTNGWTLKIGQRDAAALTYGFYETEKGQDGGLYRWLEQTGVLRVPCVAVDGKPVQITVTLDPGTRPDKLPLANVSLILSNNQYDYAAKLPVIASFDLKPGAQSYTFTIPADYPAKQITCQDGATSLSLQIKANSVWSPSDYGLGYDNRKLGVKVLAINIRG